MNYPNAEKHFWASMTKSVIRITGYCLIPFDLQFAVAILVTSEIIGIVEEVL